MKYCRINLDKTAYNPISQIITFARPPITRLQEIFKSYCEFRNFEGVMPLFESQYTDPSNDVIGYTNREGKLVAFSLLRRHDSANVESVQFAWDYQEPRLRLGIKSIEHECAVYKKLGYRYLYLGLTAGYKQNFIGYEEVSVQDV